MSKGPAQSEAESLTRLGARAFTEKDFAGASAAAQMAVQADPKHFAGWVLLGASLARLKHHHDAAKAYLQALAIDPEDIGCWTDLGELYVLMMKYDEATAALRQAMQLDPNAEHPAGRRARAVAGRTMSLLSRK